MDEEEELRKEIDRKNEIYSEVAEKIMVVLSEEQRKHKLHILEIYSILHFLGQYITRDKDKEDINIIQIKKAKDAIDKFTDYFANMGKGG